MFTKKKLSQLESDLRLAEHNIAVLADELNKLTKKFNDQNIDERKLAKTNKYKKNLSKKMKEVNRAKK